ncbi:MAG: hypothetical protein PHF86_04265 [Candidatus Nanoarchaeia archaeon]|jgi:hypothetical protein|nr:hypothetical protein [Candidatus Nanoarchaeia archaeon]
MKYNKIRIETDGTSMRTLVFIDDVQIGGVQRLEFSADGNDVFAHINIQVNRKVNGVTQIKKIKIRDPKTEKFVEKDEIETEPLILERIQ